MSVEQQPFHHILQVSQLCQMRIDEVYSMRGDVTMQEILVMDKQQSISYLVGHLLNLTGGDPLQLQNT